MRLFAVLRLLALAAPVGARALVAQGTGTTSAIVLELPATARALGLAGAYAAVVGDEGSVFVNPAGMATIRRLAVGMSWERSLLGTTFTTAAAAMRVGRFDLGIGLALLDFGGDSVYVPSTGDPDVGTATGGTITAYQALGVGAVAYRRGMISLGASVKALREHIASGAPESYSAHGVTGDAGLAIAVFDIMAFGFVMQNVAGRMTDSDGDQLAIPRTTRVGFTLNFIDPQGTARLMTTTDFVAPPGGDSYWAMGFEGGVVANGVGATGRLGIALGRASSDRRSLVYGGTIQLRGVRFDWSYQPFDAIGASTHRFGVRWIP
jgi:hypothetical protein